MSAFYSTVRLQQRNSFNMNFRLKRVAMLYVISLTVAGYIATARGS